MPETTWDTFRLSLGFLDAITRASEDTAISVLSKLRGVLCPRKEPRNRLVEGGRDPGSIAAMTALLPLKADV